MPEHKSSRLLVTLAGVLALSFLNTGCVTCHPDAVLCDGVPRELDKVSLPEYVIEPPDVLLIDAVRLVPKPPYRIEPLDQLFIQAIPTPQTDPVGGIYPVEADGTVNLGLTYGAVRVEGMTTA